MCFEMCSASMCLCLVDVVVACREWRGSATVEPPRDPTAAVAPWPSHVDDHPTKGSFGVRIELLSKNRINKTSTGVLCVVGNET